MVPKDISKISLHYFLGRATDSHRVNSVLLRLDSGCSLLAATGPSELVFLILIHRSPAVLRNGTKKLERFLNNVQNTGKSVA